MKPSMVLVQAGALLVTTLFLSGCDKLKEMEELKNNLATYKQQMDELNVRADIYRQQISELRIELALVREKLATVEPPKKKVVSDEGPRRFTGEQIEMLKKVIAQCIEVARASAPKDTPDYSLGFYTRFDAYYNVASGLVQNNVRLSGEMPALYAFNKCMASQGWPLT